MADTTRSIGHYEHQVGQTQIVRKFQTLCPLTVEKIAHYFTRLITQCKILIGSHEAISYKTLKTHPFSAMPIEYNTTITILEKQIPVQMAPQVMDQLQQHAD